jgi:hypothetical protein
VFFKTRTWSAGCIVQIKPQSAGLKHPWAIALIGSICPLGEQLPLHTRLHSTQILEKANLLSIVNSVSGRLTNKWDRYLISTQPAPSCDVSPRVGFETSGRTYAAGKALSRNVISRDF